ncbi:MAG TPA: bifunctional phosphopantothenoylcysteine decarboxylase/phosphopantothenate--cysteine ligase CoaBC [Candidatus Baltobacteraceae bacterium]|nr:bifunctional phosphopantothenoylcysteine decarboxylase/phosphopantothenate--cysteine ligase CoaBC [Candidatus Baltobacteraceae bacterium]
MPLKQARILLCVSGGIAAYKAAALTSTLVQQGAIVDVMMTPEAERFIAPLTFSSLTARPVYTSLWDEPERIPHIRLVREAQVAMVAPATANVIAKLAHGIADDLVTAALLAARIPVIVAPAMNDAMYRNEATQTNLRTLAERGVTFVEPESGFLAERESGIGRLASEERLVEALRISLQRAQSLRGVRLAITAGPTREAFDPVRFVSNPSTGATGIALAREAAQRGADVTLILGPTHLGAPAGVRTVRVETAQQMLEAALQYAVGCDVIVASAAVSDWRPAEHADQKVKKTGEDLNVRMVRNPDVLAEIAKRKGKSFIVGFAAETQAHETNAREKLQRKHLDAIVVNDVSEQRGWGAQHNALTVLWGKDGRRELGEASKTVLASRLFDCIEALRHAAHH